ncbi:MAG: phosphoribosylanthranilate isomerase [Armatimonadetes bacterium]|nr:phosphoribosylanthranilate isomerase [Armatimonadota bacterium]
MVTRVKICGLTLLDDALFAEDAGAEAVGFILEPTSKRCLSQLDVLEEASKRLGPYITTVAVFGYFRPEIQLLDRFAIQASDLPPCGSRSKILAIQVASSPTEADIERAAHADAVLLDASVPGQFGGTGHRIDSGLLTEWSQALHGQRVIIAGGLNPENVADVISRYSPYAVDVASGVETTPGIKDREKVARFIAAAKGR